LISNKNELSIELKREYDPDDISKILKKINNLKKYGTIKTGRSKKSKKKFEY